MQAVDLKFDKKKNIDFSSISGEMPGVDVGFFHTQKTTLAYDKRKNQYSGTTTYTFRNGEISENFNNFQTSGNILIEYTPGNTPHLIINEGSMDFKAFGQSVNASQITYDSESPLSFKAGEITLNADIHGYKPNFEGKKVLINQTGMHFDVLSTEPNLDPEPSLGPFTINPKKLSLLEHEEKGYILKVDGQIDANFPNQFGTVNGTLEGGVTFSTDSSEMNYFITRGEAQMSAPNPFNKIGDLLGGVWSGSRFEISADIPVFPGVFAVFGIFLAFDANFNDIIGTITLSESDDVLINLNSGISATVEAGFFGGIQAGSQLLAALAILLEMTARNNATLGLNYRKSFGINNELQESDIDPKKSKDGFHYIFSGDTKGSVRLKAVATALYFFQKEFILEGPNKSLGEFSFSDQRNEGPNPQQQEFFTKEQLEEEVSDNISETAKNEVKNMSSEQLLDIVVNRRFESGEKKDAINVFKKGEEDRKEVREKRENDEDSFDETPLTNLYFFNEFINNRVDWGNLVNWFFESSTLTPEVCDQKMESEEGKQELRAIIEQMGNENNIASSFISFYVQKIKEVKTATRGYESPDGGYIHFLEKKIVLFNAAEKFKKDHLHSSFWGDEKRQRQNIRDRGYKKFKRGLSKLYSAMQENNMVIPIPGNRKRIKQMGSDYLLNLRKEHRNRNNES